MSNVSSGRVKEILNYCNTNGREKTMEKYGVNAETLRRYRRKDKGAGGTIHTDSALVKKITARYTTAELESLANGHSIHDRDCKHAKITFSGKSLRIGHITDTHIGSRDFHAEYVQSAFDEFRRQGVQFICHTGDVTEGMSHRPGHVYELSQIGYQAQLEYACKLFRKAPCKVYAIDGNHDRWYIKSNGAIIVKNIAKELMSDKFEFLGHDQGDIIVNGIKIRLFHGEDANSYATSYRLQKIVEAMRGGDKPNVLLVGHTHKTIFMPSERNVHCFSGGCIQEQTAWMRGKRIAAHPGFWIIDMDIKDGGVSRIGGAFYPFY